MTKWLSPSLLIILLVGLGGTVLYALGRWDASVDEKWKAHEVAVDQALKSGARYRTTRDSLQRAERAALSKARVLEVELVARSDSLDKMQAAIDREVEVSVSAAIADLLPRLQLRPIGENLYATDSAGVRFLESLRLEARKAELVPLLQDQVQTLTAQVTEFQAAAILAGERADSAGARVLVLEGLLREGQKLRRCRIAMVLPCPSRGLSFVLGGLAGATAAAISN